MYTNCSECQNKNQFVYKICSDLVAFVYWTGKSTNNLLSYCGLIDQRISASDRFTCTCVPHWTQNPGNFSKYEFDSF